MRRVSYTICLAITLFAFSGNGYTQERKPQAKERTIIIFVSDKDGIGQEGIVLTTTGKLGELRPTDKAGKTTAVIPYEFKPGSQIHFQLQSGMIANRNWEISPTYITQIPDDNPVNHATVFLRRVERPTPANNDSYTSLEKKTLLPDATGEKPEKGRSLVKQIANRESISFSSLPSNIKDPNSEGSIARSESNGSDTNVFAKHSDLQSQPSSKDLNRTGVSLQEELQNVTTEIVALALLLGHSLYEQKKFQEAFNSYMKALEYHPNDDDIHYYIALSLTQLRPIPVNEFKLLAEGQQLYPSAAQSIFACAHWSGGEKVAQ